jgi:hypothetical protein
MHADMAQWIDSREAEIAKIAQSAEDTASLQQHVSDIVEDKAFKASPRCEKFLRYVINRALSGNFESLKERVIGMELFGRPSHYETGEDAIVRVTASDVRRRLAQYYSRYGTTAKFHIALPAGSYIPDITRKAAEKAVAVDALDPRETASQAAVASYAQTTFQLDPLTVRQEAVAVPALSVAPVLPPESELLTARIKRPLLFFGTLFVVWNIALCSIFWIYFSRQKVAAPVAILPWSALFHSPHTTRVITADATISNLAKYTGAEIPFSDYANHTYVSATSNKQAPDEDRLRNINRIGGFANPIDVRTVASIARLAQANSGKIEVDGAREIELSYLKGDDNFIFLGSPQTNPWVTLFSNQLDFQIVSDKDKAGEFIRNAHPRPNEQPAYIPTALGWATGQSFAIVAFVQNLDQSGQVLLLAGLSAEGSEAAGKFVTDLPGLSRALQQCGISPSGPLEHFELLLRLNTMAGSPTETNVVACHILPGPSA